MRLVTLLCLAACLPLTASAQMVSPQPGDVYREFTLSISNASEKWRVTDPDATAPGAQAELPNPILNLNIPAGQLTGAIRAELLVDYWGGHPGTTQPRVRLNGNAWLALPALTTTPQPPTGTNAPECFVQQWNPVVAVPLAHLEEGQNAIEGTSGGQTCFGFGWGQWGWYGAKLRVYYDHLRVPNPIGAFVTPSMNATIGENPILEVAAVGGSGIARVEFYAHVEAYDWDGDGVFLDWTHAYHRGKFEAGLPVSFHAGTATLSPYRVTFDTSLLPDQPSGSIRLLARIQSFNGLWYVTPSIDNVTLLRAGSVVLARPENVPPRFWVRETRPEMTSRVTIPASVDLSAATDARLLVRTWNGVDGSGPGDHATRINGWTVPVTYGEDHHHGASVVDVDPTVLVNGTNTIRFSTTSEHHGIEILWPGPALLVRTGGSATAACGDASTDPGEECDDGNQANGDGCELACLLPEAGPCGDGYVHLGEACDDGNLIDGDGCQSDCMLPYCGDGIVDPGEDCDDADLDDEDGCHNDCTVPSCGDGRLDAGEECDDGNELDGDGCRGDCMVPFPAAILPGLWPFSATGSTVLDDSGNGNSGSLAGGAQRDAAGKFGAGLRLDGIAGHVDLGGLSVGGAAGTWAVWFRTDGFTVGDPRILSKATSAAEQDHWFSLGTIAQGANHHLRFRLKIGGQTRTLTGVAPLPVGAWVHAAATYDGSVIRLYQDGALVAAAQRDGPLSGSASVPLWIGDQPGGGKPFKGWIDEVLIDDRAMSATEIQELLVDSVALPFCGDGAQDPDEECDDGNAVGGDGCRADCTAEVCGDAIADPNEGCDDGNAEAGDGCRADCTVEVCGDGILDPAEICDDGGLNSDSAPDACRADCTLPACGDGVLDSTEECDDGNEVSADGCQAGCLWPVCGDGIVDEDESCDAAEANSGIVPDACRTDCTLPRCGDGTTDTGEGCDDANAAAGDGCRPDCTRELCGDGRLDPEELCDDGPANSDTTPDACRRSCVPAACGDGTIDGGEACDDGNTAGGDGCRADCTAEVCGDAIVDPGEGCDEGPSNSDTIPGACRTTCIPAGCGDGVLDAGESCDDGNTAGGDGCQPDCRLPACGDGIVDPGEACDDGDLEPDDGCEPDCTRTPFCGDGLLNRSGETCEPPDSRAGQPDQCRDDCTFCGDGSLDGGEVCDDGNNAGGDGCRADCTIEACGDGVHDPGEGCDDGAFNSDTTPDGCRTDCALASCGDGVLDSGEACDDGNLGSGDGCRGDCTAEICGDGIVDPGEACDDGNPAVGDGCRPDCAQELCGDGIVDPGEACDAGELNSDTVAGACRPDCTLPSCGDGVVDPGEQCDDGNAESGDGCRPDCTAEGCGDSIPDPGEGCDEGTANSDTDPDACRMSCTPPACGDGVVDSGEECDDGNWVSGDGCRAGCLLEVCGDGVLDPGEACDDGNLADGDGCQSTCRLPACGDGIVDPGEACDDGNLVDDDGCGADCAINVCGDGEINAGERCDDGNAVDGDGCDTDCTVSMLLRSDRLPDLRDEVRLTWGGVGVAFRVYRSTDPATLYEPSNALGITTSVIWVDPVASGEIYYYGVVNLCGNGDLDSGEDCDDGNRRDGDGCPADCGPGL